MTVVPFVDLKAQYRSIKPEIDEAIERVFESAQFVLGEEVTAFEEEFASYCGTKHCVAVNSGTSALHLALLAAGIGPGDEVITVPNTFIATVAAICYAGARPVFVDIDPRTFNIDPKRIEGAISRHTKAIIPVHLYGQPAEMDLIAGIAQKHGVLVIDDAAQAHGANYKGRRVGSMADMACFSFYPAKNLGAYGEGGAVTTNDSGFDRTIRMLRDWGQERKHNYELLGYNYRMDGIQGAILRVKLRHLDGWIEARRRHASRYDVLLANVDVQTPTVNEYGEHVYHLYVIRAKGRDTLQSALREKGIQTAIHYPTPVHLQPAFTHLGFNVGDFPHAERAVAEVLSLPMFPELAPTDIRKVCGIIEAQLNGEK